MSKRSDRILDIRQHFKEESGGNWLNDQGEPDIDYVYWLEKRLDFAESLDGNKEHIDERWEIYKIPTNELIGKKVISIKSGFSGHEPQIMKCSYFDGNRLTLDACEESRSQNTMGWTILVKDIVNSIILYNE